MEHCFAPMTLLLVGFTLSSCSQEREFHYVPISKTWDEARQYCREKFTDLAKIESQEDVSRLKAPDSYNWAWIGLRDDPKSWKNTMGTEANSWRWSTTGEFGQTGYHAWSPGEPNYKDALETCVVMTSAGLWADQRCDLLKSFTCFSITEKNEKEYVYISVQKTWSSALTYCRTHHRDLAVIENEAENVKAKKVHPTTEEVWIGLYRVPWMWGDKSQTSFQPWDYSSLNNNGGKQHCGTENFLHKWGDEDCTVRRVFFCHHDLKKPTVVTTTTVRVKFGTDIDLTDPAIDSKILQQLGALLSRQGWTDFKLRWKSLPSKNHKEKCSKRKSHA